MQFNFGNGEVYEVEELTDEEKYLASRIEQINRESAEMRDRLERNEMAIPGYSAKLKEKFKERGLEPNSE